MALRQIRQKTKASANGTDTKLICRVLLAAQPFCGQRAATIARPSAVRTEWPIDCELACDARTIAEVRRRFVELEYFTWQEGVYGNDARDRNGTTLQRFAECLWDRTVHDWGIATESLGAKKDRRLLASMQLPGARHDLSSGQCASERAAQARAHQEPASGPLGVEPRTGVHVCPSEPSAQEIRPQHDLHGWPWTRCAGGSGTWLS